MAAIVRGPWLTRVLFNARPVLSSTDFAWPAVGHPVLHARAGARPGVLALARHRDQMLAWLAGVAVLAAVTLTAPAGDPPGGHRLRGRLGDRRAGHGGRAGRAMAGPQRPGYAAGLCGPPLKRASSSPSRAR